MRRLEIGPGHERLPGFETLNILPGPFTDHLGPAQKPPFPDNTFDEVYSSHCIEHVEWYEVESTIREWVRILKPGGVLEVHTVNAVPLLKALIEWEENEGRCSHKAGKWRSDLHNYDPFLHASGRLLCYSKRGDRGANLHRAILTPLRLRQMFERAYLGGIVEVAEPRGSKKHKSAPNIGLRGVKQR